MKEALLKIRGILLAFMLIYTFPIVTCAENQEQQAQQEHVIALTDLDFNNDGYINQKDLDILKSHFNERYTAYVPWDLNADLLCDYKDFYYFTDHVSIDYQYQVAVNLTAWNLSNYVINMSKEPAVILDEVIYPMNPNRVVTWVKHRTSLESPKDGNIVCVHYTRDLCSLAYKSLGPKTIARGSSSVHAYGIIYTGGDWRDLSNWYIIDPFWKLYKFGNISTLTGCHNTKSLVIFLDKGRYGYWAIHLSVDYQNESVYKPYKTEYRMWTFREH